jgi:hypothetical protein
MNFANAPACVIRSITPYPGKPKPAAGKGMAIRLNKENDISPEIAFQVAKRQFTNLKLL